jgi:hypothetical protein
MAAGEPAALLLPLVAMAGLTLLVWLRLYQVRLGEMARRRIEPQSIAAATARDATFQDTRASDNFRNLFELPVLFYAGVLAAVALGHADAGLAVLAWAFVALRAAHSLIHCSYNRVVHRFAVYVLGALALFAFWGRLGWMLLG